MRREQMTINELTVNRVKTPEGVVVVPDGTTYTLLEKNTNKVHIIPDLTGDCTITLPAAKNGLHYPIQYGGVAADAQDWTIITPEGNTVYFLGGLVHLDSDAAAAGDEIVPIAGDGNSNSSLNVLTPDVGTLVDLWCQGGLWYLNGQVVSATVPAFADQ